MNLFINMPGSVNDWRIETRSSHLIGAMQDRFVAHIGGYMPLFRIDHTAASKALHFAGFGGRAVGGWNDDALTLAVEAARSLPVSDRLVFASTSAPWDLGNGYAFHATVNGRRAFDQGLLELRADL